MVVKIRKEVFQMLLEWVEGAEVFMSHVGCLSSILFHLLSGTAKTAFPYLRPGWKTTINTKALYFVT